MGRYLIEIDREPLEDCSFCPAFHEAIFHAACCNAIPDGKAIQGKLRGGKVEDTFVVCYDRPDWCPLVAIDDPDVLKPIEGFTRDEYYRGSMLERDKVITRLVDQIDSLRASTCKTKEDSMKLEVMVEDGCEAPFYAHEGDAGMDLRINEDVWLQPMERRNVKTGLRVAIPDGCVGDVRPRSGLASKKGVTVINTPGTIDSRYRGEIGVPLVNISKKPVMLRKGDRIAQLVVTPYVHCEVEVVDELDETERGTGGFGSTGMR